MLREAVGESTFEIWLEQVELFAVDGSGVLVLAVNEQTASWVRERFGRLLADCVERTGREFRFASEPERRALSEHRTPDSPQRAGAETRREGGTMTVTVVANQKGGVGKTTTAANVGVALALRGQRVLVVDADPQFALTRQLGLQDRALGVNLVDVLVGRAGAGDAIVAGVHGIDVIAGARELAGVEMSLVGELGRERFLGKALGPALDDYDHVAIDTPPNLGLLTVNALVCANRVLAPVSVEDEASLHGILELR